MLTTSVETTSLITVREFEKRMRPGGNPLIVRGWMGQWPALSTWDFAFFKRTYGSDRIALADEGSDLVTEVSMADYVDYLRNPSAESELKKLADDVNRQRPFYCLSYKPFKEHPELLEDFTVPPFVADWWPYLNDEFTSSHFPKDQGWIFLGAGGSSAPMHQDSHHTIAWLAQIVGTKEYFLFSPGDSERVYRGAVDPSRPDLSKFPLFDEATCHRCILEPGEMLFLPPDWWHYAQAADNSITLSCNFVNHINFGDYLVAAFGSQLPAVLAALPGSPMRLG